MDRVARIYELLLEHFGPQHWWPAETQFEVVVGALLMPQTSWTNVETAIANLKGASLLEPSRIVNARLDLLTRLVRQAGLHRSKPRRLRDFCRHVVRVSGGDIERFLGMETSSLRRELLSLEGVGPETADSILLYAGGAQVFVVDAYTVRVGQRVGLFDHAEYGKIQRFFQERIPGDVSMYKEYHALIVALAKHICRPRPLCQKCPLASLCDYARSRSSRHPASA